MTNKMPALHLPGLWRIGFLLVGMLIMLGGCAAPERKLPNIVWPLPPDEPRVKFVDIISNTADLGWGSGLAENIFGEERVATFSKPYGVAAGRDGKIYIADLGRVWVLDMKNKKVGFVGVQPGVGRLRYPLGLATTSDGRLLVTDISLDRVYVYRDGGLIGAIGHDGEFDTASGVAVDEAGKKIYVTDSRRHLVAVYSLDDYKRLRTFGKRGTEKGEFNYPTNIAVDQQGRVYVVDTGNFRVQVFDRDGNFVRSIGQIGDMPGSMARPKGIAIDSEGNVYIVDTAFDNFQIFNESGALLLAVGNGGTEPGEFLLPAGIAIDQDDRIYVVNQIPPTLQIFQYLGEKWKKSQAAGTAK